MKTQEAQNIAKTNGYTLRRVQETGEWRACPCGGRECSAYYTDDLADAVGTILAEAKFARERAASRDLPVIDLASLVALRQGVQS